MTRKKTGTSPKPYMSSLHFLISLDFMFDLENDIDSTRIHDKLLHFQLNELCKYV